MSSRPPATPRYPETRRDDTVETLHGRQIADPYRWLEDPDSPETRAWVEAQNAVTEAFLAAIPERGAIRARLGRLWDYERYGLPQRRGRWFVFSHNDGLQNQDVLLRTTSLDEEPVVLLDPNTLSEDGTVALGLTELSDDGSLLAYSVAESGSDWVTWRFREVATGRDLPDVLRWSKFSGAAWLPDGTGFLYSRYAEPTDASTLYQAANRNHLVYLHRIGEPQERDELVFERPDQPDWLFEAQVSEDGRWLIIYQFEGTNRERRIFLRDLSDPGARVEPFLDRFDASYTVVGNDGTTFYVLTDRDAPRGRLVAIERSRPEPEAWRTLIAEGPDRDVLAELEMSGDRFVAIWRVDAHDVVRIHRLDGSDEGEVALPTIGSIGGLVGRRSEPDAYLWFTSFTRPGTVYRLDPTTRALAEIWRPRIDFDPDAYEVSQVRYPSRDGTLIPMFVVHRRGLVRDGSNPTYLYGYGGFEIPLMPAFSAANMAWLEMGGTYAQASLRGGGEYGTEWHDAGRLGNKQNVFDDFIAAAEWLISEGYTSTPRLAIGGRSNGGLLVGACLTQRPDLFGAALPAVGVLDMLRFHRFTIGWAWTSDYGSPDDPADFEVLLRYSPLHNLRPGTPYPATLVTTADHDDRVVPGHSFKFIAALQAAQAGDAPVLARIETRAGHGAGKPTTKLIAEWADMWTFLFRELAMETAAATDARPGGSVATFEETDWRLISCVGPTGDLLEVGASIEASARFEGGRVAGSAGCNRYTGGYMLDGEGLTFGPLASTMMMCPEPQMRVEMAFLAALERVASWALTGSEQDGFRLELRGADGQSVAVFSRAVS
jgi:prolyl oligopeptidase